MQKLKFKKGFSPKNRNIYRITGGKQRWGESLSYVDGAVLAAAAAGAVFAASYAVELL